MEPVALMVHVPDVAIALDWYQKAFPSSYPSVTPKSDLAILDVNGFSLEIVRADSKVASGQSGSVLYWVVPDMNEVLTRFLSIGAKLYRGPMPIENGSGMCQVEDPFGNLIGLRGKMDLSAEV